MHFPDNQSFFLVVPDMYEHDYRTQCFLWTRQSWVFVASETIRHGTVQ
jgi:hypothetical protein